MEKKNENLFTPNCIRTFTGNYVNVFDAIPELICIEDIAHALSMQCRFGGHLPEFYSVAQHSVEVSKLVPIEDQFQALMHDASEAYLLDIPSPIKSGLRDYKDIEDGLMRTIASVFNFQYPLTKPVKDADAIMLQIEWDTIMLQKPSFNKPRILTQAESKELFMETFNLLAFTYPSLT